MNTKDTSSLIYNLRYLIFQTVKSDYAALVSTNILSSNNFMFNQYQYFSKLLNKSYYHNSSTMSSNSIMKVTIYLEDQQELLKRLVDNNSNGSIDYQKVKLLAGILF
jgi:hypothetical protein